MGLIWTILIGFLIGTIAKVLVPGKESGGFILTTLLGIAGSWVGGWLFGLIGMRGPAGFIGSVIGAVVILLVYRWFNGRNHSVEA
jgi:uncharacterized membrane protein YeaQ/YmgE (transglycosylase-associated protein family)